MIGLFFIAAVSIYSNFYLLKNNISHNAEHSFKDISRTLKHIIDKDTLLMEGLIDGLKKDPKSIELFQEGQKECLFMYLHQTYMKLHSNYQLTHFYIHKPNRQNYIRVHNKNTHSDFINRTTLKRAAQTLATSSGVEFGISHNLTLRVVSPWIVDGKLIGFIELGKEIDLITQEYTDLIESDLIFTIKKELITDKDFQKWRTKNYRNRFYHAMNNFYVIDSTIKTIESKLQHILNLKKPSHNVYVENGAKKYYINSQDYFDVNGKSIGKLFILNDVTQKYAFLYEVIGKTTLIVLILLLIMFWYYAKYIQQTESQLNVAYRKIQESSIRDGLTRLYNKKYYLESVPQFIQRCSRFKLYISFILIDADNFKKYNDNYGHLKGDDVLIAIAQMMLNVFKRQNDYCYRVGGEEFLVVSASVDQEDGLNMAQLFCDSIRDEAIEHKYNANFGVITTSLGVVTTPLEYTIHIDTLYDQADKALYQAKYRGRNQVALYHEDHDENH